MTDAPQADGMDAGSVVPEPETPEPLPPDEPDPAADGADETEVSQ